MIPHSLQLPSIVESGLSLHDARENSYEKWRAKVTRVYLLVLQRLDGKGLTLKWLCRSGRLMEISLSSW